MNEYYDFIRSKANEEKIQIPECVRSKIEETLTKILADQFYEDLEKYGYEGHGSLRVSYDVVTNTDKWFTLKICVRETVGDNNTYCKYYNLNKISEKTVKLGDLSENEDFISVIENEIKRQMREIAADDPNGHFPDDDAEIIAFFSKLSETHNFYLTENGDLVVVFDKYKSAPNVMETPKFTIGRNIIADLLTPVYQNIF